MSSSMMSDATSWKRGRPAGILSLWPPLSFRAMLQAATLSAGTASARPSLTWLPTARLLSTGYEGRNPQVALQTR